MIKVILSNNGFGLSIEKCENDEKNETVRLSIFEDESNNGYGIEVNLMDLYKSIGFVMGESLDTSDTHTHTHFHETSLDLSSIPSSGNPT